MHAQTFAADLLEQLPVGVIATRPDGALYVNALARASLPATPVSCADLDDCEPVLGRLLAGDETPPSGLRIELAGRDHHVQVVRVATDGIALLLVPEALFERMHPELRWLAQSYADFQEIFRNSFDGIFVADGSGKTLMVNAGCERNYDLSAADMVGRNVREFEDRGLITPVIANRVITERTRVTAVQHTHTGKTIMVTGIPLFDDADRVRRVIINSRNTTELLQLQEELARTRDDLRRVESEVHALRRVNLAVEGIVLESPRMQAIAALAARVARVDSTILITGESGVGKEIVAKLIHRESARGDGAFIKINCGAIPRDLLESELFGYEAGAFTGAARQGKTGLIETANAGTLFLDEIGELPPDLQIKLLAVIQDHAFTRVGGTATVAVDVRIISATNGDLVALVEHGHFRKDLYYRLNVVPIDIPPLRERRDDILPLIRRCLEEFETKYGLTKCLSEAALRQLLDYAWPGNVRELRNIVERVVVTTPGDLISDEDLPSHLHPAPAPVEADGLDYRTRVAHFEAGLVRQAVDRCGSTRAAAKHLEISQATVVRKLAAAKQH